MALGRWIQQHVHVHGLINTLALITTLEPLFCSYFPFFSYRFRITILLSLKAYEQNLISFFFLDCFLERYIKAFEYNVI